MAEWTIDKVKDRIERAAKTFERLPDVKGRGYFNSWPEHLYTFADKVGQEPKKMRIRPSPRDITEAEETLVWLRWLEKPEARLLWLKASGAPWKAICWELGISRANAHRRHQFALSVIVLRLSGRAVNRKRSMQHLIEQASSS